jgi:hypothetical protein
MSSKRFTSQVGSVALDVCSLAGNTAYMTCTHPSNIVIELHTPVVTDI